MQEHERKVVQILNPTYATCTLHFYNRESKAQLGALNPIMSKILEMTKGDEETTKDKDTIKFTVIELAADNGWQVCPIGWLRGAKMGPRPLQFLKLQKQVHFQLNTQPKFVSVVFDGVLGPLCLAKHTWRHPGI